MQFTNCSKTIKKETGLEIGDLYYLNKKVDLCRDNIYFFDTKTYNFHLLPDISDSNRTIWTKYSEKITKLLEEIKLENNPNLEPKKISQGNCVGFKKSPNNFFRRIEVKNSKENQIFILNFMRFYIENKKVNCILGEFQFDTFLNGKKINYKKNIAYPETKFDQELTDIKLNDNGVCVYNPKNLGSIWTCNPEDVAKEFVDFIECIFFERYKYEIKKVLMESSYNYSKEIAERTIEIHIDYVKECFSKNESPDDVGIDIGYCCG